MLYDQSGRLNPGKTLMGAAPDDSVSRRRYNREKRAREEAEGLLEDKSRALFIANQELARHSEMLEAAVKERTAALQEALIEAEQASLARLRFFATMSHEIRTPLGGLLGMIDLLKTDETDPEKQTLLSHAQTSGEALRRVVNDVLDFSKLEAEEFTFETDPVDLRALIDGVVAMARTWVQDGKTRLQTNVAMDVPTLFVGDATRIRQVISNLVSNAGRYSREGPIVVAASRCPNSTDPMVLVEVKDQGVGLSPEQLPKLFKDFSQVSNTLTDIAQGTGLGLAICKRIVEGCGGDIGVHSVLGEGSTFWFTLPLRELKPQAPQTAETALANLPPKQPDNSVQPIRVLLAEDNPINQKLLQTYLERLSAAVTLAPNGRRAVELFEGEKFDLILMDVAMPEMDGFEAIRQIRTKAGSFPLPSITLLTAHVFESIRQDCVSLGIETVLSKPVSIEELREVLDNARPVQSHQDNAFDVHSPEDPECQMRFIQLMSPTMAEQLIEHFDPELLSKLVTDFVSDARKITDKMKMAFECRDLQSVRDQAHSLRGSSGLLGFDQIASIAGEIEKGSADEVAGLFHRSAAEIETLIGAVQESLN